MIPTKLMGKLETAIKAYIDRQPTEWKENEGIIEGESWGANDVKHEYERLVLVLKLAFVTVVKKELFPNEELSNRDKERITKNGDVIYKEFKKYIDEVINGNIRGKAEVYRAEI